VEIIQTQLVIRSRIVHTGRMTKRFFLICTLLCVVTAAGEQLKLPTLKVGTVTYTNVTVLGANATDLYFSHSLGFANVKLKYVGPDLQKRFDYNPKAAAEAERKQSEEDILYQSSLARNAAPAPTNGALAKAKAAALGAETGLADPISERSLLGKLAPKLEVDKWLGDKPALEGKFVLISFWAPWSVPCRQEIADLNSFQKKYPEKLAVVGISADSEGAIAEMPDAKIEYASGIDAKAKLSAAAGVTSIPFVLLCDPKGVVLFQGHPGALTDKKLQAILARSAE
jgi:cytochrome c biogenesis protein CcmG/thiol:disulfide interchange protein DsbE